MPRPCVLCLPWHAWVRCAALGSQSQISRFGCGLLISHGIISCSLLNSNSDPRSKPSETHTLLPRWIPLARGFTRATLSTPRRLLQTQLSCAWWTHVCRSLASLWKEAPRLWLGGLWDHAATSNACFPAISANKGSSASGSRLLWLAGTFLLWLVRLVSRGARSSWSILFFAMQFLGKGPAAGRGCEYGDQVRQKRRWFCADV